MKNKTITFKNGKILAVSSYTAEILAKNILSGTANDFQVFYNEDNELICVIRLSDISFIQ